MVVAASERWKKGKVKRGRGVSFGFLFFEFSGGEGEVDLRLTEGPDSIHSCPGVNSAWWLFFS